MSPRPASLCHLCLLAFLPICPHITHPTSPDVHPAIYRSSGLLDPRHQQNGHSKIQYIPTFPTHVSARSQSLPQMLTHASMSLRAERLNDQGTPLLLGTMWDGVRRLICSRRAASPPSAGEAPGWLLLRQDRVSPARPHRPARAPLTTSVISPSQTRSEPGEAVPPGLGPSTPQVALPQHIRGPHPECPL